MKETNDRLYHMKGYIQIILICFVLILGCKNADKRTAVENISEHPEVPTSENPIADFIYYLESNDVEQVKEIVNRHGANYKDGDGKTFFKYSVNKNTEITSYLLQNGYKMDADEQYRLFKSVRSDSSLFSEIYLEHVTDERMVMSTIIQNCDPLLFEYYLASTKTDLSKCKLQSSNTSELSCLCLLNHCEERSVEMLRVALSYGKEYFRRERKCLIENWIQDFPMVSDSSFVAELLAHNVLKETEEWTPLISYCRWNENSIVQMLLENGFDPNWNDSSDLLVLALTRVGDGFGEHLTAEIRNETIALLLKNGANPNLTIKMETKKEGESMSFLDFANAWTGEDNTALMALLNEYKN